MHCALDDVIPFREWALIPYLLWFVYLSCESVESEKPLPTGSGFSLSIKIIRNLLSVLNQERFGFQKG